MKFFDFLDIKYIQARVLQSKKETFTQERAGEIKAIYSLLNGLRVFYKWISVPKLFLEYTLVKFKFTPPPSIPDEITQAQKPDLKLAPDEQAV